MQQQILLIDDSPAIHALVKTLLAGEAVDIHEAMDGESGVRMAVSLRPDLVLLDVDMPGMNGFEACKQILSDSTLANVPVIFLTSCSTIEEKVRGLELGAGDYVTKPFNRTELWARVRSALRTSRLVRLLEKKALIDSLTGLGTRDMFERQLSIEVSLMGRFRSPLSCIVVEVENLDSIREKFGRPCGEMVLQRIAATIEANCRPEEVPCRYGDNEFAVIATRVTAEEALGIGAKLREAISSLSFDWEGRKVNVLVFYAVTDAEDFTDRSIIPRAESALQQVRELRAMASHTQGSVALQN
jgi:diguanylate cyclase (GGDEF)-like protein